MSRCAFIKKILSEGQVKHSFDYDLTCKGIHIVIISAQVYPTRILLYELHDLIQVAERKIVLFEKTLSSGERVFCRDASSMRL
jgi:hypothetical protein